ncbi:MAG TPA: permease [bacterium]|nr:permease [bacterium]HNW15726.1 permease [bacterium]HOG44823.1 permease [bacterium]HPM46161.1 permease [bacterium]HPY13753.1 permease [bacterium]
MNWKNEWKPLSIIVSVFFAAFFLPVGVYRFDNALKEALELVKWYAEEHVLLCLVPAFLIAGAIGVFISQNAVMKYLGAGAKKSVAYLVASVSGTILAVCSCTILPLFAGIYKRGAGLGPAIAFLYSGPAISVLSIILTARILGAEIGIARAIGAISFSVIIGFIMEKIFQKEEAARSAALQMPVAEEGRPLYQTVIYFFFMVMILVFANWGKPDVTEGLWWSIYSVKWIITAVSALLFGVVLVAWYSHKVWKIVLIGIVSAIFAFVFPSIPIIAFSAGFIGLTWSGSTADEENGDWISASWGFAKQILPLLLIGVFVAGFLLGRPGNEGIIPNEWVAGLVGGNSLFSNFFAAIVGAFMYFATLTEVPIVQGLMGSGMGKGPALSLLLAGPALSLPNMLVIKSVIGTKMTAVFVVLVVIMATLTGLIYGSLF